MVQDPRLSYSISSDQLNGVVMLYIECFRFCRIIFSSSALSHYFPMQMLYSQDIVWWDCMVGLYGGIVWWDCMVGLFGGIVWWDCIAGLYGGIVLWDCMEGLYGRIVWRDSIIGDFVLYCIVLVDSLHDQVFGLYFCLIFSLQ